MHYYGVTEDDIEYYLFQDVDFYSVVLLNLGFWFSFPLGCFLGGLVGGGRGKLKFFISIGHIRVFSSDF